VIFKGLSNFRWIFTKRRPNGTAAAEVLDFKFLREFHTTGCVAIFFKKTIAPLIISKKLESAIIDLLKKRSDPPIDKPKKGIWDFLNSGFIIAFVAGGFVTGASTIFTQCSAEKAKNVDNDLAALRLRQNFIDTFDNKIDLYMRLTHSLRKREIFLAAWQGPQSATAKYPDTRNFFETTLQWEQETRFLFDHWPGSPMGLVHTGKVLFKNSDTLKNFEQIDKYLRDYDRTIDYDELDARYNDIVGLLGTITRQLEAEAREKK
jgi:hypothetical protein